MENLVAIKYKFSLPNKVRLITVKDRKPLYLIETYNRKTLTAIIEFLSRKDLIGLGGDKLVQFQEFVAVFNEGKAK